VSPGIESTNSSSFTVPAVTSYRSPGGTPVLVVKSKDDVEKFVQFIPAALGAGATLARGALAAGRGLAGAVGSRIGIKPPITEMGKLGIKPPATSITGKLAAGGSVSPAAGSTTTALQNTGAAVPKQSMAEGIASAEKVKVNPTNPTLEDFGAGPPSSTTPKPVEGKMPEPEVKTPQDTRQMSVEPNYYEEQARRSKTATVGNVEDVAEEKSTYNVPKPFQRVFGETIDRDKAQNIGAAGLVGVQQVRAKRAQDDATLRQEMERLERLAEEGRAKASTGSKIAVT